MNNYYKLVTNPLQYIGVDINIPEKEWDRAKVKFLLAYPDLYKIGSSNLAIQILYHIVNKERDYLCDRIFAPDIDMKNFINSNKLPYLSLDYKRYPKEFDIIGFTLQYELNFTTIPAMLQMMKIPIFSKDRAGSNFPIICAGGPSAFNPLPLKEIFDFFVIGDGEEIILEKCMIINELKGSKREDVLEELSKLEGVYSPIFPKKKVTKRFFTTLSKDFFPTSPVIPTAKTVHERIMVEVSRGCTRGCRFCHAGIIYRPSRERAADDIINIVKESIKNSGYRDVSLLSLSVGDYSKLREIVENLKRLDLKISLPSIRADMVNEEILKTILEKERTGFTIAPEAGSEKLRKAINKNLSNSDIFNAVEILYKNGWNLIKLYFMIGLPFEDDEDIDEMIKLSKEVAKLGRKYHKKNSLNISISTFVPKPHTPFQWCPQENIGSIKEKLYKIKDNLKKFRNIKIKWHLPEMSQIEAVLARGDESLSEILHTVFEKGAYLEGWSDKFFYKKWSDANSDINMLAEKRFNLYEELPWDFINTGVSKEFLISEYLKAEKGKQTEDCRIEKCNNCGVCNGEVKIVTSKDLTEQIMNKALKREYFRRVIFKYRKTGVSQLLGHIDTQDVILRALIRSGAILKHSEGYKPKPKISFSPPPPFGVESFEEYFEVFIGNDNLESIMRCANNFLPNGMKIDDFFENRDKLHLVKDVKAAVYEIYDKIDFKENELIDNIFLQNSKTVVTIKFHNGKHLNIVKFFQIDIAETKVCRVKLIY